MHDLMIEDNSILIVPSQLKIKILKIISEKGLQNIKILTLQELRKNFYFNYDYNAILYLMEKYDYQYDVAKMYLSRFYEVEVNDYDNEKIKKIINLKTELDNNNLLIYNRNFKNFIKNKKIIYYETEPLKKIDKKMFNDLEKITKVEIIHNNKKTYQHECIWEFLTIEDEVLFIASRIKELVTTGVSFSQIKIYNATGEYLNLIKRIFKWFNISITFKDNYLYSTKICQDFLNQLDETFEDALKYIEDNYSLKNEQTLLLFNQIIKIVNQYINIDSIDKAKIFLIEEFKQTPIEVSHYQEEVTLINSINQIEPEDYVFLVGFNQGEYPKIYKDESYFNDKIKEKLNLETTNELNQRSYNLSLKEIKQTKNLIITTKLTSSLGEHYLSSLNDDLKLEVKRGKLEYNDSNIYNQLTLGKKIDKFIKYNEKEEDLELLYSSYENIPYGIFSSNYQKISIKKVKEYLNNKLSLSYSTMNTYYQCSFRYYLANVLKLNIFEETFYTILGNLFHYILSIALEKEIDLDEEYNNYLEKSNYQFNDREQFFLKRLKSELRFIIEVIKKQNEFNSLDQVLYEEKITINKSREDMEITFKGFVDKIMLNENESIASIVDYKTGNPDLNLNHIIYGLDLQLPVYIYLIKNKFPNTKIAGFYLQKILNNEISKDYKHSYEYLKEEKLKLQGYSNSDISILEQFDSSYYESKMIKGMRTTSKGIATKKVLNDDQINRLKEITETKIEEAIDGIINSDFEINPKRIGMDNLGCKYCQFKDICFFTEENIVNLKEYKNMEFLRSDDDDTEEAD